MKIIGVVTIYNINNYGSSLQAFALQNALKQRGFDSRVINLKEKNRLEERFHKLLRKIKTLPKILININYLRNQSKILKGSYLNTLGEDTILKLQLFDRNNLSFLTINRRDLKKLANSNKSQCFICGSDQIWSPLSIYVSPHAFLRFAPKNKRFAYAPSFGLSSIPSLNRSEFKKYLNGIPYLSTRETQGEQIIYELTGKSAQVVCDPTLLMEKHEWEKHIDSERILINAKDYILVYFLEQPNALAISLIQHLNKTTNKKIIQVYGNHDLGFQTNYEYINASPFEFLHLIRNAYCVLTDSYHGMLFSVNFNKLFWIFNRNYKSDNISQSSRIVSFLTHINLNHHLIDENLDYEDINDEIDYTEVNKKIKILRLDSKKYLDRIKEIN